MIGTLLAGAGLGAGVLGAAKWLKSSISKFFSPRMIKINPLKMTESEIRSILKPYVRNRRDLNILVKNITKIGERKAPITLTLEGFSPAQEQAMKFTQWIRRKFKLPEPGGVNPEQEKLIAALAARNKALEEQIAKQSKMYKNLFMYGAPAVGGYLIGRKSEKKEEPRIPVIYKL